MTKAKSSALSQQCSAQRIPDQETQAAGFRAGQDYCNALGGCWRESVLHRGRCLLRLRQLYLTIWITCGIGRKQSWKRAVSHSLSRCCIMGHGYFNSVMRKLEFGRTGAPKFTHFQLCSHVPLRLCCHYGYAE